MQKPDDSANFPDGNANAEGQGESAAIDSSNHPEFASYYEEQSQQVDVIERFKHLKKVLSKFYFERAGQRAEGTQLNVIDIGCGAGTQAIIWAQDGHNVFGVDVSERLIEVAKERMQNAGVMVDFKIGTASHLPFSTESMDICLLPELLEHVPVWLSALQECARVLKPGGILYVSTSNLLCPLQNEYSLPMYSWYPAFIKRICERKAVTTHRHWVRYATYPAVNWFSNPGLGKVLSGMGFTCYDRFDIIDLANKPKLAVFIVQGLILQSSIIRYLSYMMTRSTMVVAVKKTNPLASGPN